MPPIEFSELQLPNKKNYYLMCPNDFCKDMSAISPVFKVAVKKLQQITELVISQQPRIKLLINQPGYIAVTQYSWFWHFPDLVDIKFLAIDDTSSSFIIYSRSKYGYYDFGVNQRRVRDWVEQISHKISK